MSLLTTIHNILAFTQLDIYFPTNRTTSAPILIFVYGGGFVSGSRDLIPELVYDNVGAFFAQRGIVTIIPDYRLAPETIYPGPAHDVREAIRFVLSSKDVDLAGNGGDKERVYIMGHSAGAAIALTLFLNDDVMSVEDRAVFKGAILNGGAYAAMPMFASYYGEPEEEVEGKTPLGLLKQKSGDEVRDDSFRILSMQLLMTRRRSDCRDFCSQSARETSVSSWNGTHGSRRYCGKGASISEST